MKVILNKKAMRIKMTLYGIAVALASIVSAIIELCKK